MNVCACIILACISTIQAWPFEVSNFQDFIDDQSGTMKSFFEIQKNRIGSVLNSSYEEAVQMKNTINEYFESQTRKLGADINSYVESVKSSGKKVIDSYSFLPIEQPEELLNNPDMVLSVPSVIIKNGYICETHTVVSQGYLLSVHRIPHSKAGSNVPKKTVILQHGLFASSADWILNGPEKGLAYVLADSGYDVWMPNVRGNRYSREHVRLKSDSKSYWNFSWHDIALHDLPAIIDYITKIKLNSQIAYIGHSMGSTILFAMLTLRPEYNRILKKGIALAPVVFFTDIKSPLKALAPAASNVAYMEMMYGSHEFIPKKSVLGQITSACDVDNTDAKICKEVVFYICGYNEKQFNKTLLPVFLSNLGTGTSWKTAVHFAQEIVAGGKFQQFDYGSNNIRIYGSFESPEYDLSQITLPITLFWSENDLLSSEKDVMMLSNKLPSTTELYKVPDPEFNHIDYLWAIDAPTLINAKILDTLETTFRVEPFPFRINIFA